FPCFLPRTDRLRWIRAVDNCAVAVLFRREHVVIRLAAREVGSPYQQRFICNPSERDYAALAGIRLALANGDDAAPDVDLAPLQQADFRVPHASVQGQYHCNV